jgi:hypothetical protein
MKFIIMETIKAISKRIKASPKANNALFTIFPYKKGGQWMYDDESVDVYEEPFVAGADDLLDLLSNGKDECTVIFSSSPFPGHQYKFGKMVKEGDSGTFYYSEEHKMEFWLCSVLNLYYPTSPNELYVKIKY